MSLNGLTVRCLASTRIAHVTDPIEQDREESRDERDGSSKSAGSEGDEVVDNGSGSGFHDDSREHASSSGSFSSSISTPGSDSSFASSSTPDSGRSSTTSCIQEAQLSPDGTCIFTSDYNRAFSVYPIATDILDSPTARPLKVYAQFKSADPIWSFAANPLFNLQDSSSTHVLVSRRDRYITLHNALWDVSGSSAGAESQESPIDIHTPLASYKLINHLNEAVTAPLSLAYANSGTHFFAGTQNSISIFDLTYPDDPIHTLSTIPSKRNKLKGGGRGFKGAISALAVSPPSSPSSSSHEGLLAAGARTRYVGIYDALSGTEVTHFALPGTVDGEKQKQRNGDDAHVTGDGVSSLKWSPCGRYLYVAERASDVLLIYDVRNFALAVGYCAGRAALTRQKLGFDVWSAGAGAGAYDVENGGSHEVWAGGRDGKVRVWRDPWAKEGAVEADEVVDVSHGDEMPVASTLVHASGALAVTACGVLKTGGDTLEGGIRRGGGGTRPHFSERGSLDILGLSGY